MRVLLIHCFYRSSAPSGEDSVYRNEKKLLEDNGHEVITYEKFNDEIDNTSTLGKIAAGTQFVWSQKAFNEITSIIKETNPNVAHFHNIFPQISTSAYAACKKLEVPVVQTLHNFRYICPAGLLQRDNKPCEKCIEGSLLNSLLHKCYRNSFMATLPMAAMISFNRITGSFKNNVDCYIALTEFAKTRLVAGGLPSEKISIKPNFVSPYKSTQASIGKYAIFVGRLTQEKGVATLIEACKQTKHIPVKVLGDGTLKKQLESICIRYDLNVEFLGNQSNSNTMAMINNSKFLIIPSECYEGFPVVVAEAYACAKPLLGSKIGSLDEIIVENFTGRKFTYGSSVELADSMRKMWADTSILEKMSENAIKTFTDKYSPEVNLEILLSIYRKVIV